MSDPTPDDVRDPAKPGGDIMMPMGAQNLGCRDCRNTPRLHCADCPVVVRLVDRGALVKADRLMGASGLAARLRNLEAT